MENNTINTLKEEYNRKWGELSEGIVQKMRCFISVLDIF